jgi:hypothetical protein
MIASSYAGRGHTAPGGTTSGRVVDRDDGVVDELGAGGPGELLERHPHRVADRERLGHGERPVGELGVRCDERQAQALVAERAEGKETLQAGDAAAGHDDAQTAGLPTGGRRKIRAAHGFAPRNRDR